MLLVLTTALIGLFDMAQVFFIHHTLLERARNAARYGAPRAFDATAIRNMVLYNQPAAPPGGSGIFGVTADMVSVSRDGAGTTADRVVVQITDFPYRLFTPGIAQAVEGRPILVSVPYEVP